MTTIDRSLAKLSGGNDAPEQSTTADLQTTGDGFSIQKALESYIRALEGEEYKTPFSQTLKLANLEAVMQFSKWLKFDNEMKPRIIVPKSEVLALIREKSPDSYYLLSETDLGSRMADPFGVSQGHCYDRIGFPLDSELKEILNYESISEFERFRIFKIPGIDFLSLFMKNSGQIRDYGRVIASFGTKVNNLVRIAGSTRLGIPLELEFNFDFFSSGLLRKYSVVTGIMEIEPLVSEISTLHSLLIRYSGSDNADNIMRELHRGLKQYNPDLTV